MGLIILTGCNDRVIPVQESLLVECTESDDGINYILPTVTGLTGADLMKGFDNWRSEYNAICTVHSGLVETVRQRQKQQKPK